MIMNFIIATTVISIIPGPSMILIIMNSIERGLWNGVLTVLGAVLADALLLIIALSGVGVILSASPLAFSILKWVGVLYLIYLGIVQLNTKMAQHYDKQKREKNTLVQGLITTLANPKIIGFLIVFFPQFLNQNEEIIIQLYLLGPLFLVIVFIIFLLSALIARSLKSKIATKKSKVIFNNISGYALIGCGLLSGIF